MMMIKIILFLRSLSQPQAHPEFFFVCVCVGVPDREAVYNLHLILKTVLWKACQNLRAEIYLGYKENQN
jgi:hypothetical protein